MSPVFKEYTCMIRMMHTRDFPTLPVGLVVGLVILSEGVQKFNWPF